MEMRSDTHSIATSVAYRVNAKRLALWEIFLSQAAGSEGWEKATLKTRRWPLDESQSEIPQHSGHYEQGVCNCSFWRVSWGKRAVSGG
jgi:hypothetical protein